MRALITVGLSFVMAAAASAQPAVEEGSGPYPAIYEARADLPDQVVYRPRDLSKVGREQLGIYVFGNGGCGADGTASRNHLLEIASHGYLVIAPGRIPGPEPREAEAGGGPRPGQLTAQTRTEQLSQAIDWAQREAARPGSPFQGKVAADKVAASGWSCGGLQALTVAQEPRVKTTVIMNSGFFNEGANPIAGVVSDKTLLNGLHGPILYVLGGKEDIAYANGTDDYARISAVPAALVNIPVGHGGTYMQPHGGLGAEVVTAWLDWQLKGDAAAGARFKGANCGYCSDKRLTIETKGLR